MDANDSDFYAVRVSRAELRLSQAQVGLLAGISQQHYSLIERGGLDCGLGVFRRILAALGLEMSLRERRTSAEDILRRRRQLDGYNSWERGRGELDRPSEPAEALAQAGEALDLYLRLHAQPPPSPEPAALLLWRKRLSLARP